jgi:MFS superfamily sulfate permease-like transporter
VHVDVADRHQRDRRQLARLAQLVQPHLVIELTQQFDAEPAVPGEVGEQPAREADQLHRCRAPHRRGDHHAVGQFVGGDVGQRQAVGALLRGAAQLGDELAEVAVALEVAGEHDQAEGAGLGILRHLDGELAADQEMEVDMGQLPDSLPVFLLPDVPLTWETLAIIAPYSVTLAVVGLLESMMTASIVDELTDTTSNKNRECVGQGVANIATGFIGGMAGCAMIGQSVINVKSGGRGRLSTLVAGLFLLILVVFLGDWVARIPMAALVAVMIMVSIGTFNWDSVRKLREHPPSSSIVMIATVVVTVSTHDLAKGVFVGVLLSGIFFAHKVGRVLRVDRSLSDDGRTRTYGVVGQVFFASSETFNAAFDFKEVIDRVVIDVSRAHFWDITAVSALDKVVLKFKREGTQVEVIGLNEASATMVDRFAVHDKPGAVEQLMH